MGSLKKGDVIAFTSIRDMSVTARIIKVGQTISSVRNLSTGDKMAVFNHMMVYVKEEKP